MSITWITNVMVIQEQQALNKQLQKDMIILKQKVGMD